MNRIHRILLFEDICRLQYGADGEALIRSGAEPLSLISFLTHLELGSNSHYASWLIEHLLVLTSSPVLLRLLVGIRQFESNS